MGGIPGANGRVRATVIDGSGNLYIGGDFTAVGDVVANHIAKWNGRSWSVLGSGMNDNVFALAVSGVTDDEAHKSVTIPSTNSEQFFRLRRP